MTGHNHNTPFTETSAILLAGGMSRRMGCEKAFLDIGGIPLIQHIYNQLQSHFQRVIVSANNKARFSFLEAEVVEDKKPGMGPLMGIASGLELSHSVVNFIIACDIPDIDYTFVARMIDESRGYDGVIPINNRAQYEPLYGIYKKSMLPAMNSLLATGVCKISRVFTMCHMCYIPIREEQWMHNLNTREDYKEYMKVHGNDNADMEA